MQIKVIMSDADYQRIIAANGKRVRVLLQGTRHRSLISVPLQLKHLQRQRPIAY